MFETFLKTVATSLASGLVLLIIVVASKYLGRYSLGEYVQELLLTHKTILIWFLVLLLLGLPIAFSLPTGSFLTPTIAASFVREVFISAIISISFYISWQIFKKTDSVIHDENAKIYDTSQPMYSLKVAANNQYSTSSNFNDVLVQWDAGEISDTLVKKEQILYSLHRWIELKNEAGWYELDEQINGKLTDSKATWMVFKELNLLRQRKSQKLAPVRNHNYEKRLESLIDIETVGDVWLKWDKGLVSEETAYEAQEINALKKWLLNRDETGWLDLQSIIQNRRSLAPRVVEFAKYELQEILARKEIEEIVNVSIEQRLRDLVLA